MDDILREVRRPAKRMRRSSAPPGDPSRPQARNRRASPDCPVASAAAKADVGERDRFTNVERLWPLLTVPTPGGIQLRLAFLAGNSAVHLPKRGRPTVRRRIRGAFGAFCAKKARKPGA